jgi:hypothetical protein
MTNRNGVMLIVTAASFYFLFVFGVGSLLGPVRVFWLQPQLGEAPAVLCEAPFLLVVIISAARWVPRKLNLQPNLSSLVGMGLGALILQQIADFAVGSVLRGIRPLEQIARLSTPAGLMYLALVLSFAGMPVLANRLPRPLNQDRSHKRAMGQTS